MGDQRLCDWCGDPLHPTRCLSLKPYGQDRVFMTCNASCAQAIDRHFRLDPAGPNPVMGDEGVKIGAPGSATYAVALKRYQEEMESLAQLPGEEWRKIQEEWESGRVIASGSLVELSQPEALEALIDTMAPNAQDTLQALERKGYRICRKRTE